MKGIKKVSLLALGLFLIAGVASCDKKTTNTDDQTEETDATEIYDDIPVDPEKGYIEFEDLDTDIGEISTLEEPESFPDIYINEANKAQFKLMSLSVDTTNARTTFYLGEEFNADGLLVLGDFMKLDSKGQPAKNAAGKVITVRARVTNYQVDGSEIDTSEMGYYTAQVNYRYGDTVKNEEYQVRVRSSEFETTRNLVYIAGLKAGYKSTQAGQNFKLKNDGRIATTYLRKSGQNDFSLDASELNVQIVKNTVNGVASAYSSEYIDFDLTTLTNDTENKKMYNNDQTFEIDYSQVDTGKVGSYLIPMTYKGSDLIINGRTVPNTVKAFLVVDVISPVTNVVNTNSNMTVEASMGLPDFGQYNVNIARRVWDGTKLTIVASRLPITSEAFKFENIVTYSQGGQNGTFTLKEIGEDENGDDKEFSFNAAITITESTKYDIRVQRDVSQGTVISQTIGESDGKYTYNEYDFGDGVKAYNVGAGKLDKNNIPEYLGKGKTCAEDGLKFVGFLGLDSVAKKSYIEFTFEKETTLILYIGSNGDDDRGFVVYKPTADGNEILFEENVEVAVAGAKQTPVRRSYTLPAGTYRVSALGTTVTFHGFVIGTLK